MAEVRVEGELGASPEEAWTLIGDFVGLIEAMGAPVEAEGPEGVGQIRKVTMGPEPVVERCEARDDDAKSITYSIVSGPLPVADYRSTMQLEAAGEGRSKLTWTGTFEPVGDEAAATGIVNAIYSGGITALQGRFGA